MKFLCDVYIPIKLAKHLQSLGFETLHVTQMPNKSETTDAEICAYADLQNYVVLTKDADFKNSFLVKQTPKKLMKINLGNIPNNTLIAIISKYIKTIAALEKKDVFLIEIDAENISLIEM